MPEQLSRRTVASTSFYQKELYPRRIALSLLRSFARVEASLFFLKHMMKFVDEESSDKWTTARVALEIIQIAKSKSLSRMYSKASILGHPIHPVLVPFPIAFFILAFIADCAYETGTARKDWAQLAYILIIAGITMALAAAIPALVDYYHIRDEETKATATAHMTFNMTILILESINLAYRASRVGHYWRSGWILSLISVPLLAVSGWLGHHMVFVRGQGVKELGNAGERRVLQNP